MSNPVIVPLSKLTISSLRKLRDEEIIQIEHQTIRGCVIEIRKDFRIETVLNQSVVMYGRGFIIKDNTNNSHPQHSVVLEAKDTVAYVNQLLDEKTISDMTYTRSLKEKGVSLYDIVEFADGKRGVICPPNTQDNIPNLKYIPLKSDGTLSRLKPRWIYGGDQFQKVGHFEQ